MKTFKDLKFEKHAIDPKGQMAGLDFDNAYGISVVRFFGSYGYKQGLYEVAVLYCGDLTYNTNITDDVIGHCDENRVTEIMKQIQLLKD